jgi:spermidine synthase
MEDSRRELRKHLPIWMKARGRVLVTGLGLGCVVRGLLASRDVDRIEVVEIDYDIARIIGAEFAGARGLAGQAVEIHVGDAREIDESWLPGKFDAAWHDLWTEGPDLQEQHIDVMMRMLGRCGPQGAWALPRFTKKMIRRHGGGADILG